MHRHYSDLSRRRFLTRTAVAGVGLCAISTSDPLLGATPDNGKTRRALFDGQTLKGWRVAPRLQVPNEPRFASIPPEELRAAVVKWHEEHKQQEKLNHVGRWEVVDGAIVGGHEPPESLHGAYLDADTK